MSIEKQINIRTSWGYWCQVSSSSYLPIRHNCRCYLPDTYKHRNTCAALIHSQTYHLFPRGKHPGAKSDPDMRAQRSKSLFFQVYPLLFIHANKRKGWRARKAERQRGIPQREAFEVEKTFSFLICPLMEYTWHILLPCALSASSSLYWLFHFVYICMHAHVASVMPTRVRDGTRMR